MRSNKISCLGVLLSISLTLTTSLISEGAFASQIPTLSAKTEFCVQSFNVFGPLYARYRTLRMKLIGQEIQKQACDVVQLQEVWTDSLYGTLQENVNPALSGYVGYHFNHFIPQGETDEVGHVGLAAFYPTRATFSKIDVYPINYDLTPDPLGALEWIRQETGTRKALTISSVKVADQTEVIFINTHTHPHSTKVRVAQIIYLASKIESLLAQDKPIVVTGDLNAGPNSLEIRLLRNVFGFRDAMEWKSTCTYCLENPFYIGLDLSDKRFDYILYLNSSDRKLDSHNTVINMKGTKLLPLSDHYGLKTWFTVEKTKTHSLPLLTYEDREALYIAQQTLAEATLLLQDASQTDSTFVEPYRTAFTFYTRLKLPTDDDHLVRNLSRQRRN